MSGSPQYKQMLTKNQFTKQIAENIRQAREKIGVSQEELAHRADLYRTYIGHLENARYSPSGYVLYKISHALDTDMSRLVRVE